MMGKKASRININKLTEQIEYNIYLQQENHFNNLELSITCENIQMFYQYQSTPIVNGQKFK